MSARRFASSAAVMKSAEYINPSGPVAEKRADCAVVLGKVWQPSAASRSSDAPHQEGTMMKCLFRLRIYRTTERSRDERAPMPLDGLPLTDRIRLQFDKAPTAGPVRKRRQAPARPATDIACPARRWRAPRASGTATDCQARRQPPREGHSQSLDPPIVWLTARCIRARPGSPRRRLGLRETVRTRTRRGRPQGLPGKHRADPGPSGWPYLRPPGDRAGRLPRPSVCPCPGYLGGASSVGVRRTRSSGRAHPGRRNRPASFRSCRPEVAPCLSLLP